MTNLLALGDVSKANEVHVLKLLHPDTKEPLKLDDGTELTISYVGSDSDEAREANHENRRINVQRASDGLEYNPEVEDAGFYRLLAYVTKGWTGIPRGWIDGSEDASPIEFTQDAAFKLYKRQRWVRQQINAAFTRSQNFGTASRGS